MRRLFELLLSWSASRMSMLRECPRRFHYHYIASFGGGRSGAPPESHAAWLAKRYTTVAIEVGSFIHATIANLWWKLIGGGLVDIEREPDVAVEAFADSVVSILRGEGDRRFLQDVFGPELELADLEEAAISVGDMMRTFFGFPFVQALIANPTPIMTAYLDRDQPEKTHALGFPAYMKTDLVIRLGTGIEVIEWKTGRPSPTHVAQAEIYDLYVRMAELLPATKPTRVHIVYLKTGHVDTREFGEAERTLALRQAHEGYLRIQDLFGPRNAACLEPALFPPQPGGHCSGCNFQGLCPESATKQSAAPAAAAIVIEDDF